MAEKDVVRITFQEIESIVDTSKDAQSQDERSKGDDSNKKRRRSKRPEQAIYRPGQLRVSKKEKDSSNMGERMDSSGLTGENWDAEMEAAGAREFYGMTDEDSSRDSKENSVEKDQAYAGSRIPSGPSMSPATAHRDKGRRSKRPDIQIYVPKGRHQDSHLQGNEEDIEVDQSVEYHVKGTDFASSVTGDEALAARLRNLSVDSDRRSPAAIGGKARESETHSAPSSVPDEADHRSQQGQTSRQRGQSFKEQDEDRPKHSEKRDRRDQRDRKKESEDRVLQWETSSWHEREHCGGRGRRSADRNLPFSKDVKGSRGHGAGGDERDSAFKEPRVGGRGRGRGRQLQYNRSSSSESLSKSVDLGHRSEWPAERATPYGGTFPRSKGGKGRGQTFADDRDVNTKEDDSALHPAGSKHAFTSMRPPRERSGSISSDTSGGSDLSWEDLEAEYQKEKPDWNTQVEQYLEEVARQVHDSTQRMTDSIDNSFLLQDSVGGGRPQLRTSLPQHGLNRNLSASSDRIFSQEYRGRKKDRRRRGSNSKNSSRDSSIHSNPRDDALWQAEGKRSNRRRNRRRHSSAGPTNRVGTVEGQRAAESLRIMVGKNREKRQVMVGGKKEGGGGGDGQKGQGGKHGGSDHHKNPDGDRPHQHQQHHQHQQQQHQHQQQQHHPQQQQQRDRRSEKGGGGGPGSLQHQHPETPAKERRRRNSNSVRSTGGDGEEKGHGRKQQQQQEHHSDRKREGQQQHIPSQTYSSQGGPKSHGGSDAHHHQQGGFQRKAPSPGIGQEKVSPSPHSHAGGLIKLPSEPSTERPQHFAHQGQGRQGSRQDRLAASHDHSQDWGQGYGPAPEQHEDRFRRTSGQGQGQGVRGSEGLAERRLYDPKNPGKPIMVPDSRPLKFQDTEEAASSPQDTFTPPPLSHSPGTAVSPGPGGHPVYPGPPFFPPHPGYMYPPPHMRMPFPGYPHGPPPPPNHPMFYGFGPPRPALDADDAYYNRELEQMVSGMSRPQCRMMAEQILRDTAPLDCQLANILSRGHHGEDGQRRISQLRHELQRRYERVILLDVDVANQRGVEQQLWRSVYYNVIEGLRKEQQPDTSAATADIKKDLLDILDEGAAFYESLLSKLQSTYQLKLDVLVEDGVGGPDGAGRGARLAVLSAQRTMMFLGDIARYREQASLSTNYGKARSWYIKAQKLAPKNGRPYNQLAILAMYTRRKLDAVYFYQRSLAASNPILTARESLMSIFDDVRRKEEAVEQRRVEEARQRRRKKAPGATSQPRVEIWVAADGSSSRDHQADSSLDSSDLSNLSSIELNKRFVLTFLNVHGKLFTKINFEVFVESSSLMLQEWQLVLQHSPPMLTSARLLQVLAINMFSIDNTALKDESLEASCRSLLQEHAVEVGLDMFGLLVARINHLFITHLAAGGSAPRHHPLSDDLQQLLPSAKVWVDWMMCHSSLWNPQPSLRPPDIGPQVDVWKNVAALCNTLRQVNTSHTALHRHQQEGREALVLMEDSMMAGFVPLLSAPVDTVYIDLGQDKEAAMDCLRVEKLVLFGEYLCGIEPPMLSFAVETGRYFSVAPAPVKSEERLVDPDSHPGSETEDVVLESEESGEDGDETPGQTIRQLKARKAELRQRVQDQARDKHNLQSLVEKSCGARLELEVRPRFLVADTNCFIDHLSSLRSIVAIATYTLVVPLVVLNELDGLAKGAGNHAGHHLDDSPEHITMVTRHANQALTYLEAEFKAKNSCLRVQTSKGSILETLAFRSEESDSCGNNDDLILSCCLHYCKDMARDFMPKDKDCPVRLFRDVVLLTDDRNLRLKAHTSNVPVKDVPAFCRWSKVKVT